MSPEEVARYLEAIKRRSKMSSDEVIDEILKEEKGITRKEARELLREKPTSKDAKSAKRNTLVFGIPFLIWNALGIASYLGYLDVNRFLFWTVFVVLGGLSLGFFLLWKNYEYYSRLSTEEYLREVLRERKARREDDDDDPSRNMIGVPEPGHLLYGDTIGIDER